jgi:hypothetical protein
MLKKAGKVEVGDFVTPEEEIKDPFVLEFLGLKDEYSESELEEALILHLESFLLELGGDFAFVARQRRLRIGDEWYRVDLLLFHRKLPCFVVIDLKLGRFTHADADRRLSRVSAGGASGHHAGRVRVPGVQELARDSKAEASSLLQAGKGRGAKGEAAVSKGLSELRSDGAEEGGSRSGVIGVEWEGFEVKRIRSRSRFAQFCNAEGQQRVTGRNQCNTSVRS